MEEKREKKGIKGEEGRNNVRKFLFVGLAFLFQIIWLAFLLFGLSANYFWVSVGVRVLTTLSVIGMFGRHTNPTIKMSWIFFIMAVPVLGWIFYILSERSNFVNTMTKRFQRIDGTLFPMILKEENRQILAKLRERDRGVGNQAYFLQNSAHFPLYQNTDVRYFPETVEGLQILKEDLKSAERFVFMEYHAIEDREVFGELKEILRERAALGVEVRIFYDEVGSVGFLTRQFIRDMEGLGIRCRVFNPIMPVVNLFMNNRDHRKITVIDGKIGYTGGFNLADEYFNRKQPYGYWKDTGIRMEGDAVRTLTMLFLEMWNAMEKGEMEEVSAYLPGGRDSDFRGREKDAYIQPFADTPLDELHTGEDVYLNALKNAKEHVYIMSPYLILTDDMSRELTLAARRGVDVRIVTPGIPDKPIIYQVSRSYFNQLAREGVRIYEYSPGFCHGKQLTADGELAVIGTINFDYRSLYHHFENGVLLYHYDCIREMEEDFRKSFRVSREVTDYYREGRSTALRIGQCVLRLFAPLM